jgi:cofilin
LTPHKKVEPGRSYEMAAGFEVADASLAVVEAVKEGDLRWATFSVDNETHQIVVDRTADRDAPFESLFEVLRDAKAMITTPGTGVGGRFATAALEYDAEGGLRRRAIVFILWAPDGARIKEKMIYSSCKYTLKLSLAGIDAEFQTTELSELQAIRESCAEQGLGEIVSPSVVKSANKR